jgi:hypothetical protein
VRQRQLITRCPYTDPLTEADGRPPGPAEIEHFKAASLEETDKIVRIGGRHPICRPPSQRHFAADRFGENLDLNRRRLARQA